MRICVLFVVLLVFTVGAVNNRPIIGILNQNFDDNKHTYIAASYVKWIESSGARVVPLFYDQWSADTMEKMLIRLKMDLYYLEHQSLWMDIKILWKTFTNIVSGKIF